MYYIDHQGAMQYNLKREDLYCTCSKHKTLFTIYIGLIDLAVSENKERCK